jgi:hypothetical protein
MNTQTQILELTGVKKTIFIATVNFYLQQGFTKQEAEKEGFKKLASVEKLKNNKSILRY